MPELEPRPEQDLVSQEPTAGEIIVDAVEAFIQPVMQAERYRVQQETIRHAEEQKTQREQLRYSALLGCVVVVGALGVVFVTYLNGDPELAKTVIVALLAFAGGYGFGKANKDG